MSLPGCSPCVRVCNSLQHWTAAVLCTSVVLLQMAVLDYYLIHHLGRSHLTWLAFDAINITLLIISIHQARTAIHHGKKGSDSTRIASGSMGWVAWFFMSVSVAAKSVVIFKFYRDDLDDTSDKLFGPNVLKTTIALGSCTFFLLLITQHDASVGSDGRKYIEELTDTVVFDILDTVDILKVLLEPEDRDYLWDGLEEFILAVAVLNLVLPTVPLFTLAKSKFGQKKLSVKLVHGHRILLVLVVNIPNLLIRFLLWHGLSTSISPFMLKNILAISLTLYDIYEQNKEEMEECEGKEENYQSDNTQPKLEKERGLGSRSGSISLCSFCGNSSNVAIKSGIKFPVHAQNVFPNMEKKTDKQGENVGDKNQLEGEKIRKNYDQSVTMSRDPSVIHDDWDGYSLQLP
ncbi:hypothetical protein RRG08_061040 [Elysia crispata]|uniref:Uncharacterized protein n=1 Tax=Elysia crispata TaxID=231223 RepID=A0AAE1AUY2_9GAST|nr:hypothetical protein RRG08_061040 [Elysia crispata]